MLLLKTHFTVWLRWLAWSRLDIVRKVAMAMVRNEGEIFEPRESAIRVLAGGDVCLDPEIRMLANLGAYQLSGTERPKSMSSIQRFFRRSFLARVLSRRFFTLAIDYPFPELLSINPSNEPHKYLHPFNRRGKSFKSHLPALDFGYPFEKIRTFFHTMDLVFVNLETPLSDNPRPQGLFRSDPRFAMAIRDAGISVVSLANNHAFDAGEKGFMDTVDHLTSAGVQHAGAGKNIHDARKGRLFQLGETTVVFLAYTQFCNARFASTARDYPGIMPMDREIMVEDICSAKQDADLVIVSLHWGIENHPNIQPGQIKVAHQMIDAGADCIIGHHPHVPHGIEVYRKRPILYSLGNFVFSQQNHHSWDDNFLAEIVSDDKRIEGVIIHPISGRGVDVSQPELLTDERAHALLCQLQTKSVMFNTGIAIKEGKGYIKII